jgi:hypothetical protein
MINRSQFGFIAGLTALSSAVSLTTLNVIFHQSPHSRGSHCEFNSLSSDPYDGLELGRKMGDWVVQKIKDSASTSENFQD